jgi:hypothetical protein
MAVIHKCDACKKPITGKRLTVDVPAPYNRFEFCERCANPILAFLKRHKLAPRTT